MTYPPPASVDKACALGPSQPYRSGCVTKLASCFYPDRLDPRIRPWVSRDLQGQPPSICDDSRTLLLATAAIFLPALYIETLALGLSSRRHSFNTV